MSVGWIVLVLVATTVGTAPFIGWRIVEDIRYTSTIDPWLAPRYGVSVFRVHPEIFDNAAKHIPPGDTYFLASSPAARSNDQGGLPPVGAREPRSPRCRTPTLIRPSGS